MEPSMNEKGVPLMERLCRIDLRVSLQIIHLADRSWWVHQDSNLGPAGYEPVALTAELWTLRTRDSSKQGAARRRNSRSADLDVVAYGHGAAHQEDLGRSRVTL